MYATIYDEAVAKGMARGIERGMARGIERGMARGTVAGEIKMLLHLLDRRGLSLSSSLRERVEACEDGTQLREWFDRALTATSADEIFDTTNP